MIIYLEANIGAGKSTLLSKLEESDLNIKIIQEPVNEWLKLKDKSGSNILDNFYKDSSKWAFAFQINAFYTRIKKIEECTDDTIYIVERSIYTDKNCFAKNCYVNSILNDIEWNIYNDLHSWAQDYISKPFGYIYLKTTPEVCMKRIKNRSRKEEVNLSLDYLKDLDKLHDNFIESVENKKLILNGNLDYNTEVWLPNIISKINNFISE